VIEPEICISRAASNELLKVDWRDDIERAAGLIGHAKADGNVRVEHVVPSRRFAPAGPHWVKPDLKTWLNGERFNVGTDAPGEPDKLFVGNAHSHPSGDRCASEPDFRIWSQFAAACGWPCAGIIVTAPETRWEAGEPCGGDWGNPRLFGWVAFPSGDLLAARIRVEDEDDAFIREFELRQRVLRGEHAHGST
jgi:hypothetical protein